MQRSPRGVGDVGCARSAPPDEAGGSGARTRRGHSRTWWRVAAIALPLLASSTAGRAEVAAPTAMPSASRAAAPPPQAAVVAQQEAESDARDGALEPTYPPRPPEPEPPAYDSRYLFALTRGVADSTLVPAAKAPLFLFTLPLDVVLLPFAAIAGLF